MNLFNRIVVSTTLATPYFHCAGDEQLDTIFCRKPVLRFVRDIILTILDYIGTQFESAKSLAFIL